MPTVPETFRELARLLEGENVPFVVVGAIAAGLQGEPRFTDDVDVMISLATSKVPELARKARERGFDVDSQNAETQWMASGFFRIWYGAEGGAVAIDLMAGNSEYLRQVAWRAQHIRLWGIPTLVASPEDIILLKLLAWREKDVTDARAVVIRHGDRLDAEYLRRWAGWFGEKNTELRNVSSRLECVLAGRPIPPDDPAQPER